MYLEMVTHTGLTEVTRAALATSMPRQLRQIVRECFELDLADPSELQVLPPVEGWTPVPGMYVFWTLQGVLNLYGRNFHEAHAAISAALTEIFLEHEVPQGQNFSIRGVIPHIGSMGNVVEDLKPVEFKGRKPR